MFKCEAAIIENRMKIILAEMDRNCIEKLMPLEVSCCKGERLGGYETRPQGGYRKLNTNDIWYENCGHGWETFWFRMSGKATVVAPGKRLCARVNLGSEALVYDRKGCASNALSVGAYGTPHFLRDRIFLDDYEPDEDIELWIQATTAYQYGCDPADEYSRAQKALFGKFAPGFKYAYCGAFDENSWQFALDMEFAWELYTGLAETSVQKARLLRAFEKVITVYDGSRESKQAAREILRSQLELPAAADALAATVIGHSHLDSGFMWPLSEGMHKAARTFSIQMDNIERHEGFVFGATSALHYAWVKQSHPELFERVKRAVAAGRWDVLGACWVEPDGNMPSGEAWVRQIIYGNRFFREEFGVESQAVVMPDTFGHNSALPQIFVKSGIKTLLTNKLKWNQHNAFPHDIFRWRGKDGTEVLALCPLDSYGGGMSPGASIAVQGSFSAKGLVDEIGLMTGMGDGGGGPCDWEIERTRRQSSLLSCPRARFGRFSEMFERLQRYLPELPVWDDELYLEMHRGVLTTQAKTKKYNRLAEERLRALEYCCALSGNEYPRAEIRELWRQALTLQFHDILPGSSVNIVYAEAAEQYRQLFAQIDEYLGERGATLIGNCRMVTQSDRILLYNTGNYSYSRDLLLPEDWKNFESSQPVTRAIGNYGTIVALINLPPQGNMELRRVEGNVQNSDAEFNGVEEVVASGFVLENEIVRYVFDGAGVITSAVIKREGFEYISSANRLELYEDNCATVFDAWDVEKYYEKSLREQAKLVTARVLERNAVRSVAELEFLIGNSAISQQVVLRTGSAALEFRTRVNWQEEHKMLRVAARTNVRSRVAAYDNAFGIAERSTHRNTPQDMSKFECCGHKFVDLSDGQRGFAVLNDSKYGYKAHDNFLDLCLLRSPKYPDPLADRGAQEFTYTYLPHAERLSESVVLDEAFSLNRPLLLCDGNINISCPLKVGAGLTLDTLKVAEDEDALIARLYEPYGKSGCCQLFIESGWQAAYADLCERDLTVDTVSEQLCYKPFEIITLKLRGI